MSRKRHPKGVRVGWWNLGDGPWRPKAAFLTFLARAGFQIIHLSEAGDRLKDLREWAETHGFLLVVGDGPGGDSTPALVIKDPEFRHASWRTITDRQHIGAAGAGPSTAKAKGILKIRFGWLRTFGIHTLASVQQSSLPNTPKRRALWKRLVGAVGDWVTANTRPGAAGGDYNLTWPHALFPKVFRRMVQVTKGDTHETGRRIDLVFAWYCQAVDVVNLEAPSDHNLVGATFIRRRLWRRK